MMNDPRTEALADTQARLLALEMVTTAVLNQLAAKSPEVQSVLADLADPAKLPKPAQAGGEAELAHLQSNVARLAGAIASPL